MFAGVTSNSILLVNYALQPICKNHLLSGLRSSPGHHRCIALLYVIPIGIFDCVLGKKNLTTDRSLKTRGAVSNNGNRF